MIGMRWRLFTFLAALSFLLCAAALVSWPAGYWRRVYVYYRIGATQVGLQTRGGTMSLGAYRYPSPTSMDGWGSAVRGLEADDFEGAFDFGHLHKPPLHASDNLYDGWWCPHWFLVLLFGATPAVWFVRFRKRREWLFRGRCKKCGYDLRATPGRCPECGTIDAGRSRRESTEILASSAEHAAADGQAEQR
jgi:hypothetical protein